MTTSPAAGPSESIPERGIEEHRLHAVSDVVSSKAWQLATLLVPIVLTTWLTFWVSQKEDNIKQDIDKLSAGLMHTTNSTLSWCSLMDGYRHKRE